MWYALLGCLGAFVFGWGFSSAASPAHAPSHEVHRPKLALTQNSPQMLLLERDSLRNSSEEEA